MAGGDAAALLLFAIIGRANHGEVLDWETLGTALPFMIGETQLLAWLAQVLFQPPIPKRLPQRTQQQWLGVGPLT
jgi:hypothetical protein